MFVCTGLSAAVNVCVLRTVCTYNSVCVCVCEKSERDAKKERPIVSSESPRPAEITIKHSHRVSSAKTWVQHTSRYQ